MMSRYAILESKERRIAMVMESATPLLCIGKTAKQADGSWFRVRA